MQTLSITMQTLSRSLSLGRLHDAEPAPAAPALTRGRYRAPAVLHDLAAQADVSFDGDRPWDIQVHDPAFDHRVLLHRHRSELLEAGYDARFLRMWRYYLMASAGLFRSRRGQL